ncbi:putative aminopeptidase NPEPL1 granny smith protein [Arctopsyche grandis]|uniref:putative aminopeptidase NPEPL1 granny smith protein n=1 Tax=Arctopsyche grandis TaxID=121162 RepID=UPI00406D8028
MPGGVKIEWSGKITASNPREHPVLIVGQLRHLKQLNYADISCKLNPDVTEELWLSAVNSLVPGESVPLVLRTAIATLPARCSRHSAPARPYAISQIISQHAHTVNHSILLVCEKTELYASASAIARSYPLFWRRLNLKGARRSCWNPSEVNPIPQPIVTVDFLLVPSTANNGCDESIWKNPATSLLDTNLSEEDLSTIKQTADAIRLTALIVDTPTNEMNVDHFLEHIKDVGHEFNITPTIIRGEELLERGFGGIYGVGKAASVPPALAVLSWTPDGATETVAWVGKGIVYDTGGLSIKSKTGMPGMKRDCGGAAAILGAFKVAVLAGFKQNLHAIFCLAENSVGPDSTRPDDIHKLYSGRTVEINNTDAEGRLVLADGVAYAQRDLGADIIVDMATLTGAQSIAVGKYHAAILTNNEEWEDATAQAGRAAGDMVFPVPYAPELHFSEFSSAMADMKNSVGDRNNAQVSCAGLFVGAQLGWDFPGIWLHIDMAAPSYSGERATGYGVTLLNVLFGKHSKRQILQDLAPNFTCTSKASPAKKMCRD